MGCAKEEFIARRDVKRYKSSKEYMFLEIKNIRFRTWLLCGGVVSTVAVTHTVHCRCPWDWCSHVPCPDLALHIDWQQPIRYSKGENGQAIESSLFLPIIAGWCYCWGSDCVYAASSGSWTGLATLHTTLVCMSCIVPWPVGTCEQNSKKCEYIAPSYEGFLQ